MGKKILPSAEKTTGAEQKTSQARSFLQRVANFFCVFSLFVLAVYAIGNFTGFVDETLILLLKILAHSSAFWTAISVFLALSAPLHLARTKDFSKIIFAFRNVLFAIFGAAMTVFSSLVIFISNGI